ncbi:MAG: ScyD/ScyE family protein [Armatimonadetes bacterium]|nr:ScyD/ScyE family protein [Anaerolineae bacterium]
MVRKSIILILVIVVAALTVSALVSAQEAPDVVVEGLNNPRHIRLSEDGTLYVAEAGLGGETEVTGPFGPALAGLSAQISAFDADGEATIVLPELVSMDAGFGQVEGVTDIYVTESAYWVVFGLGPQEAAFEDKYVESVIQIDRASGDVWEALDLRAFEAENNPDAAEEIVSNPINLGVDAEGTLYIVDASANSVLTWTISDGLKLFAAWEVTDETPSAVPTAVAFSPEGDVYIGFLSGFPFPAGGARIERYSADGELLETYEGLTLVTDLHVAEDGTLYAVEMASGFGDTGYIADSGRIVTVSTEGIEVVAEGLNIPYGMAIEADGNLLVTVNSAFNAPDSGMVVRLAME